MSVELPAWIEVGSAGRPMPGQSRCGDGRIVVAAGERVLVAVVDGLGHGDQAAMASEVAVEVLSRSVSDPLELVFKRCHQALSRTRGVVMTVGLFARDEERLYWAGVGNVEGVRARPDGTRERLLAFGGIVGHVMRRVHVATLPLEAGDTLVLVTDGIRSGFVTLVSSLAGPQALADRILDDYARDDDDACVMVARYLGAP